MSGGKVTGKWSVSAWPQT